MLKHDLLEFVPPNFSRDAAALVIESEEFLPGLRKLMPKAKIAFLAEEKSALCESLKVDFLRGDYTKNGVLPTEPKIFDVILAKDCLTFAPNFYVSLLEINHLLKDSGFMLTEFFNVRFVKILEGLRRGEFPMREKRFWAKWDVVKILDDAIYKEIRFLPGERLSEEKISEWEQFGFDNFSDDLITKIWLVKARKCEAEVAALKEVYTEEIRAELARILHRIEYEIDTEENIARLIEFCRREKIFQEYLSDFVDQVVVHENAANFIKNLSL